MATAKKSPLPVNPDILVWARERRDFSIEEAAAKINVKPERVAQWEVGESAPTARQGRMLAKLYDRPFLEFFASEKPVIPETELVPDYRFYARGPSVTERQTLKGIQHWAEEQRLNALALIEEIGEAPPSSPEIFDSASQMMSRKLRRLSAKQCGSQLRIRLAFALRSARNFQTSFEARSKGWVFLCLSKAVLPSLGREAYAFTPSHYR